MPSASARISLARTCCSRAIAATATCSPRAATFKRRSPRFSAGKAACAAAAAARCTWSTQRTACWARPVSWPATSRSPRAPRGRRRRRASSNISVVFFGDGATGAGAFHETLNLAALWRLPVLLRLREQWLRRVHQPRGALQRHARQQLRRALRHPHEDDRRQRPAHRVCGRARGDRNCCATARARTCSSA